MSIKANDIQKISESLDLNKKLLARRIQGQPENTHLIPDPYKEVAAGMERQFADFMIQQMNKTVGGKTQSSAQQFYKSLQDSERAKILTKKDGGLGLQQLILEQIYPKKQRTQANYNRYLTDQEARNKISRRNQQVQINKESKQEIEINKLGSKPEDKDNSFRPIRLKEKVYEQ